jgi:hypothetical protein
MGRVNTIDIRERPAHDDPYGKASEQDAILLTREFWETKTGCRVTEEDAREMLANVCGFFSILSRWDRALVHDEHTANAA